MAKTPTVAAKKAAPAVAKKSGGKSTKKSVE